MVSAADSSLKTSSRSGLSARNSALTAGVRFWAGWMPLSSSSSTRPRPAEAAVGGAGLAEVDLTLLDGVLDLGAAEVERHDLADLEAVDLGEPALAVGAALAVRRGAELDRLAQRGEVGQRREVVGVGELLGDEEGVLVGGLGRRQDRDALLLGQWLERGQRLVGVVARDERGVGAVLLGVEVVGDAREVVGHDVDVAVAQLGQVDVAGGHQLGLHGVALVLEDLLVDRGHHRALGEVLAADDRAALVGAAAVVVVGAGVLEGVAAAGGRGQEQRCCGREPECARDAPRNVRTVVHHLLCPAGTCPARVRWAPRWHPPQNTSPPSDSTVWQ